jgi:hypothetical protein
MSTQRYNTEITSGEKILDHSTPINKIDLKKVLNINSKSPMSKQYMGLMTARNKNT